MRDCTPISFRTFFLHPYTLGDVVNDANEMRRDAVCIVQRTDSNFTTLPAGRVHGFLLPSHGLTGSDRLPILVQHHSEGWLGDDIPHEGAHDLLSCQPSYNKEVTAH